MKEHKCYWQVKLLMKLMQFPAISFLSKTGCNWCKPSFDIETKGGHRHPHFNSLAQRVHCCTGTKHEMKAFLPVETQTAFDYKSFSLVSSCLSSLLHCLILCPEGLVACMLCQDPILVPRMSQSKSGSGASSSWKQSLVVSHPLSESTTKRKVKAIPSQC
jgi:hypothetical protein